MTLNRALPPKTCGMKLIVPVRSGRSRTMTDDQLKAMEASAPLLVAEVRNLQTQLRETGEVLEKQLITNARQREELESIRVLVGRLVSFGMGGG
jgi:prophage DNA circulation protein